MKRIVLLIFCTFLLLIFAQSQPVYQSSHYAGIGDNYTISVASPNSLTGMDFEENGQNCVWDYSALRIYTQREHTFIDPDDSGYRESFIATCLFGGGNPFTCPDKWEQIANLASPYSQELDLDSMQFSNIVSFYRNTNDALENTMFGITVELDGTAVPMTMSYDSPDSVFQFPIHYGDIDSCQSRIDVEMQGMGFFRQQKRINYVEGYGELITPYKTFPSVLKIRTLVHHSDTVTGVENPIGISATDVIYTWLDTDFGVPVLQVRGNSVAGQEVFTSATFVDTVRQLEPQALFYYTPATPYLDPDTKTVDVSFKNLSQNADCYFWDFGDNYNSDENVSQEEEPVHTYSKSGTYLVTLKACNALFEPMKCDSIIEPVAVLDTTTKEAVFIYTPLTPCHSDTVWFANLSRNFDSYFWDFDDPNSSDNTSTEENPKHVFSASGTYQVKLVGMSGETRDSVVNPVVVSPEPYANAGEDITIMKGDTAQLHVDAPVISVATWEQSETLSCLACTSPEAFPVFTTKYYVTVSNVCGSVRDSVSVIVESPKAIAGFEYEPEMPCFGENVSFTNLSENAESYFWDFDDPNSSDNLSTIENPGHTFSNSGSFDVKLKIVTNENSDSIIKTIKITPQPTVDAGSDTTIWHGDTATLSAQCLPDAFLEWENDGTLSCSTCLTVDATPLETTVYRVNAFNHCGISSDSVTVTVEIGTQCVSISRKGNILIFPNPANDVLFVTLDYETNEKMALEMYNLSGILVRKEKILSKTSRIDISGLPSGVYLFRFTNGKKSYSRKVTIK